jgi:hypothetical protein
LDRRAAVFICLLSSFRYYSSHPEIVENRPNASGSLAPVRSYGAFDEAEEHGVFELAQSLISAVDCFTGVLPGTLDTASD